MLNDSWGGFFAKDKFYMTPDGAVGRFLGRDRFYIDLELATKEEVSYQISQVTPIVSLTERQKDDWVLDYLVACL